LTTLWSLVVDLGDMKVVVVLVVSELELDYP
jgi:hypothetical protein